MEESLPFPVSVGLLPTAPISGITASKKNGKKRYSWRLGQGVRSMWGKKDFFGEEEATTRRVFASLYLEGTGLLIQLKTSRSAQRTEVPETGPCISPSL